MILFSAPSETENYNNQVNVKAYREFDVEKGKKNNNEIKKKRYTYVTENQIVQPFECSVSVIKMLR